MRLEELHYADHSVLNLHQQLMLTRNSVIQIIRNHYKGATIHHYNWLAVLWEQLHFSAYKKHKSNSSPPPLLSHTFFPDFPGFFTLSNVTHNTTFKSVKMLLWSQRLVCT